MVGVSVSVGREAGPGREFVYPPRPTAGLVGRFGLLDLGFFAAALLLLWLGFRLVTVSVGWLIGLGVAAVLLAVVPLPRPGGRPVTAYLRPVVSTVLDRVTGRGVFRGAVFAPSSLAFRMELPGDLAGFRMIAAPTPDGVSSIGVMVHERERVACAALLTFGSSVPLLSAVDQGLHVQDWQAVMETFCAEGASVKRWQLLVRTAPDVVNVASRHAQERAVHRSGVGWQATQELLGQAAPAAPRQEVYLVVAFDLAALAGEIDRLAAGGGDRDEATGIVVLERLLELERGVAEARIATRGWLRPGQYAASIHTQLDPESLPLFDVLAGQDRDLDPRLAGPAATERSWATFRHDSAVSQTVWVHELPARAVPMNWLSPVLAQTGVRRTVSLVAEPLGTVRAQASVQRQTLRAEGAVSERRRRGMPAPARMAKEARAAVAQDEALADGDGVFRYHLFVTVTAADERTLRRHMLSVRRRLIRARCQSLVLYGEQDQAFFAGALPLARGLGADARAGRGMTGRAGWPAATVGGSAAEQIRRRVELGDDRARAAAAARAGREQERQLRRVLAGVRRDGRGARGPGAGRLWHRMSVPAHTAPSRMLAGLYPWILDPGLGVPGAYVGSDLLSLANVQFDPFELYAAQVISSPNIVLVGEIGTGKSALMKSLILRLWVFGVAFSWVQVKPEYEELVCGDGGDADPDRSGAAGAVEPAVGGAAASGAVGGGASGGEPVPPVGAAGGAAGGGVAAGAAAGGSGGAGVGVGRGDRAGPARVAVGAGVVAVVVGAVDQPGRVGGAGGGAGPGRGGGA